jgi:AraC-like DNA-binding protein
MTGNPVVIWLLALALFDDAFVLRRRHFGLWLAWVALGLANCYLWHAPGVGLLLEAGPLLFCALALWPLLGSWRGDLVEGRPALRRRLLAAVMVYSVVSTVLPWLPAGGMPPAWAGALDAAVLMGIAVAVSWPLLGLRPSSLWPATQQVAADRPASAATLPGSEAAPSDPASEPAPSAAADPAADPGRDDVALAKLDRAMREGRAYRREGLTIGALAADLGLPEYRLRRAINRQLGHRNFNTYLNGLRIAEAKAALADPSRADHPVLGIAIDAGFQSLGPFNRAFKAETGLTPTEFRRRAGVQAG